MVVAYCEGKVLQMAFHEKPKGRAAEVGGDEEGTVVISEYKVIVEYWCVRGNGTVTSSFWDEWFNTEEECVQFVRDFNHGIVRQAWIDKITTTNERSKLFDAPVPAPEVRNSPRENIMRPISGPCFHGESWYRCPKCQKAFEYYDTVHERGFKHVRDRLYQHICGQVLDMT